MTSFRSILGPDGAPRARDVPSSFADLNLDQVVGDITAGRDDYDLAPLFYASLPSVAAIEYRHEVFGDLGAAELRAQLGEFARGMGSVRRALERARSLRYRYECEAWFLEAAETYRETVARLGETLTAAELCSPGVLAVREDLATYAGSEAFTRLSADVGRVRDGLADIHYSLNIDGSRVRVSRYESEPDYSAEVERTFAKFKQGAAKDHSAEPRTSPGLDHVEQALLGRVARLHPEAFAALDDFCERYDDFQHEGVVAFDREIQFYVAYLELVDRLRTAGLPFCFPRVSADSKEVGASDTFDIALAAKLVSEREPVVCNDFRLEDPERIIVVSGPNQGGKTTFARTFGQLHHLASVGCPVPGSDARLHLFDALFTHFEREEDISTLSGKLEDDLLRIHDVLERATPDSIVVMNESFTSTTLQDALLLGSAVMRRMIELDLLCVYVTFVDELASLSDTTVSMVSTVVEDDPAVRTFKLERRPADGLAYAAALAERYGLTYDQLRERVAA